jgi:hypothetical protein
MDQSVYDRGSKYPGYDTYTYSQTQYVGFNFKKDYKTVRCLMSKQNSYVVTFDEKIILAEGSLDELNDVFKYIENCHNFKK